MKKDILFVAVQFVLFALYVINFNLIAHEILLPGWLNIILIGMGFLGAVIISLGIIHLNDSLTPFPTPRKDARLISSGIYKFIRHPIYTGIIITLISYGIYTTSIGRILICVILCVVFYFKSELEEKLLVERFTEYEQYKNITGRFFPKGNRN